MRRICIAVVFFLSLSCALVGQQTAGLIGTVTDNTGAVLPQASVTVTNLGTGAERTVLTDQTGGYAVPNLQVGNYQISVAMAKFKTTVIKQIKLDVQQNARVDVVMQIGQMSEEVAVTDQVPLLQTTDSQVGEVVENRKIVEMPLNGRNFTQLNLLVPGVTTGSENNIVGRIGYGARASGTSFSVNGQRSTNDQFLVDGINSTEVQHGSAAFSPSVDSIQEFRVQTSNYSAEFGGVAGGVINVVSKSGTNSLHGSAYEFLRNDLFDASNYFSKGVKPELRRNQFGGTVGGPIIKNRTFFFGSYEGTRLVKGITQTGIVPTAAMRNGDFSSLLASGIQLRNPYTGSPVPGNMIPASDISPIAAGLMKYVPLPNESNGALNYISNDPNRINADQYSVRIDHKISGNDSIFGRYISDESRNIQPKFFPTDALSEKVKGYGVVIGWNHIMGTNKVNDLKIGLNHFGEQLVLGNAFKADLTHDLGINGLCSDPSCWGLPTVTVSGLAVFGEHGYSGPNAGGSGGSFKSGPAGWHNAVLQINESFYWTKGNHNIKAGLELDGHRDSFVEALYPRGIFNFDGRFTDPKGVPDASTAFADFLYGLPQSSTDSISIFNPDFRSVEFKPWFQDDWRVTQNLTLNLGMRYERFARPVSANNTISDLDFTANPPQLITAGNSGQYGWPRTLVHNDNNNFAPRVGLAYVPAGIKSLVVRAGYGVFYQREPENTFVDLAINPPLVSQSSYILDPTSVNSFSWSNPFALAPAKPLLYFAMDPNWTDAYVQQWNLTTQWQLGRNTSVQAGYVGNKGTHLSKSIPINQASPGPGTVLSREPYAAYGSISYINDQGGSTYHSLQLQAERRAANGLAFLAGYTLSKCLDDASAGSIGETDSGIQNIRNPGAEKGRCSQDMRQRFVFSYVYELPFGRGKHFGAGVERLSDLVIGGWELSGVFTLSSGHPFTVTMSGDNANVGFGSSRPNIGGDPNAGDRSVTHSFNTAAFTAAPFGTFGNAGRNIVIGPGYNDLDFALIKNTSITETKVLQFRAEFFNAFNHPNFFHGGSVYGTPLFGVITAAQDPRDIQFGLKFLF